MIFFLIAVKITLAQKTCFMYSKLSVCICTQAGKERKSLEVWVIPCISVNSP